MVKKKTAATVEVDPEGAAKAQLVLKNKHILALKKEAYRRASIDETFRPDVSALMREILDNWLAKHG
jgi:hypothetical protein